MSPGVVGKYTIPPLGMKAAAGPMRCQPSGGHLTQQPKNDQPIDLTEPCQATHLAGIWDRRSVSLDTGRGV